MRPPGWRLVLAAGLGLVAGLGVVWRLNRSPVRPAVLGAAGAALQVGADPGTALGGVAAPEWQGLKTATGRPLSLRELQGHPVWLAFYNAAGNTMSPLMAATIRAAESALGPQARQVKAVAINLNPAVTTGPALVAWDQAHGMQGRWTPLTGAPAALAAVARAYHVAASGSGATFSATPAVFLISPQGKEVALFLLSPDPKAVIGQAQILARRTLPYLPGATLHPIAPSPALANGSGRFTAAPVLASSGPAAVRVGQGTPYLVAFFATWCPSCQEDLSALAAYTRLQQSHPQWPRLVAVDLAVAEPATVNLPRWIAAHHLPFPVVLDRTGSLARQYGVTALPYLASVSAQGRIQWRHVGAVSLSTLKTLARTP
ncbi:MAG: TlpA family protein disulfide reductase [Firmicutes bacterium]|nr:redoxin domain-containing protein [Alicyclobacillaceae bacterium]MCL6498200.1 TlpA family protein disulfide reductase [Bacillota bacterium]